MTPAEIIEHLLKKYPTAREFARSIKEDAADITRWRTGLSNIKPRAVVSICRLHPEIKPYQLNENIFPRELTFTFGD